MSAWIGPLLVLALGAGLARLAARGSGAPPLALAVPLLGVAGTGAWMLTAGMLRLPPAVTLAALPALALAAALAGRRPTRLSPAAWPSPGAVVAAVGVAPHLVLLALRPAAGWDFRYIWGLKAAVFAASGYDPVWLAWPAHGFAHPDYPPLWSDLLSLSARAGATPELAGAAWQAVLAAGLAAACWYAARGAAPPLRAAAAIAGGWAPVIFLPRHGGYAELLLAFLAAAALSSLGALRRGENAAVAACAAATFALALVKQEGMALAAGLALVALALPARRATWPVAATALAGIGVWRVFLLVHGIGGEALALSPERLARRAAAIPGALAALGDGASATLPLLALALVLALAALALRRDWPALAVAGTWLAAAVVAYLASPHDLGWQLTWSLDRVLAAPLPGLTALALAPALPAAAPPGPETPRGAAPSG